MFIFNILHTKCLWISWGYMENSEQAWVIEQDPNSQTNKKNKIKRKKEKGLLSRK